MIVLALFMAISALGAWQYLLGWEWRIRVASMLPYPEEFKAIQLKSPVGVLFRRLIGGLFAASFLFFLGALIYHLSVGHNVLISVSK